MKALVFNIRLNSLYSIRIPFTWQSALTYPVLPPSGVIGMLANAFQRHRNNKPPLEYLEIIENYLLWAGSRLLTPCVIKSYITSAITIFGGKQVGEKFTNALGRQFAYTKNIEVLAILKEDTILNDIGEALKTSPLTCGDSESVISLETEPTIKNVIQEKEIENEVVQTSFPLPFNENVEILEGGGQIYLMHEICKKKNKGFPLRSFIIPVKEEKGIYHPTVIKAKIKGRICEIEDAGWVVL